MPCEAQKMWKSQAESVINAPNLLIRDFIAVHPNTNWVTYITYIQYGLKTLYLSNIIDLAMKLLSILLVISTDSLSNR
jgi:hypothetical protein